MKRWSYISLGIIIGIAGSITVSAGAENIQTLVGKKIDGEFPVTLNGKILESSAGVIEGTSYLPVRAIGEALDLTVTFDQIQGIVLSKKEEDVKLNGLQKDKNTVDPAKDVSFLKDQISGRESAIESMKGIITMNEASGQHLDKNEMLKAEALRLEGEVTVLKDILAKLEKLETK
ncbi:hypothetical protein [Paenibacillus puerhi]|uniref:hypothetical protein n=1 Tax=Paenibacillus puerhi TaxID=2692622 RepID=UPI00135BB249|nr:hypothetical protein [Paenibacillus puerhi]